MAKIYVNELDGVALDWAVAKSEGESIVWQGSTFTRFTKDPDDEQVVFSPSTDWSQAGPIIEREGISQYYQGCLADEKWAADKEYESERGNEQMGSTPLIASMRCYVASKLGLEIEVPDELIQISSKETIKALPSKSYIGEIVSIKDADHIVQSIGKNVLVAHAPDKLDRIPDPGEKVTIKYDNKGMGIVTPDRLWWRLHENHHHPR